MRNTTSRTFGRPTSVSCGKFRIIGFRRFCWLCLMFGLCLAGSLQAQGQGGGGGGGRGGFGGGRGGGFDPAQMIAGLDKDGDGIISASEAEQMNSRMRERMQQSGTDFSKGVRVDELQQSMQRRMEERRQQGGGDQGGGGGGPDRGRDRGGDFQRSDRPENPQPQEMKPEDRRGDNGRGDNGGNTAPGGSPAPGATPGNSGNGSTSKKGRTRISPLLPDTYKNLDTDYDGQIALYEWRKGKRGTISQFVQYDTDGDGFLIAKELAKTVAATPATAAASATVSTSPMPAAAPLAPVEVSADAAVKALRAFELLDADKSGTVLGPEWEKSTRLKPLFEKSGINLAQPLTLEAFTQAFVRVGADK